ncbi:MAG: hypothetical protein ACXVA9_04520 [Bdellovibrionales bacterium]
MSLRILFLSLFFVGCASSSKGFVAGDQAPDGIKKKFSHYDSPDACKSHRGNWKAMSNAAIFPNGGYCILKASDAGKSCASSADCQSYCELSVDAPQDAQKPKCAATIPPRWDRCLPGYFEKGKVLSRGECFGEDIEVE